ncbi:MAG: hypothetical protein ACR2QK_03975 [Acidimicrobiales bacterium]
MVETCSFAADVRLGSGHQLRIGGRTAEFVTMDRLLNHLRLRGLVLDSASMEAALELRRRVSRAFGDVELAGLGGPRDGALMLVLVNGQTVDVRADLGHPDHRFDWEPATPLDLFVGEATMRTARTVVRLAWSEGWGPAEEMLAQTLAHGFLSRCGPDFSLSANSLCDWFLVDQEIATDLDPTDLDRLRRAAA